MVNIADPGRLIQQSYYAGHRLDRRADGQSKAWSPWSWNPHPGRRRWSSWARVNEFKRLDGHTLYAGPSRSCGTCRTRRAAALMRQWTGFEPAMPDVVVVRCEFDRATRRRRSGPARLSPQEVPACYCTRNFSTIKSYLGDGQWRAETQPPGPPWGKARPRHAMACFAPNGQGVAVFSRGRSRGTSARTPAARATVHRRPVRARRPDRPREPRTKIHLSLPLLARRRP